MSLANRMSRDDFRKAKELEELRKTGAAPPETDEDGKMINPHIPQYISQAPWYLNNTRAGLKHQRRTHFEGSEKPSFASLDHQFVRGQKIDRGVRKWQKGACENCGAMSHKTKDCCERPRAKPARITNEVAPDEVIQPNVNFDFDGKRDRWNGYDPAAYSRVIQRFEKVEQERKKKKAEEVEEQLRTGKKKEKDRKDKKKTFHTGDSESDTDSDLDESSDDEDKKDDGAVIQKFDHKSRTTVRNLRIREDRAKYLYNLNVHSAYYDPKTRSMRENPHPDKDPSEVPYAGDNWVRKTGEAREVAQLQSFVFEANDRGNEDVHMEANPSAAQLMFEEHRKRKEALKENRKQSILSKYGGQEHLDALPQELLLAQSEAYVEYSEDGKIIKGQEKAIPKSKYPEDQLENKHTEIWGSFYKDGKWGYACCHQVTRNAYCTGQAGKEAMLEMSSNLGARVPFAERRQLEAPSSSSSSSSSLSASSAAQSQAEVNEDTSGDEEEEKGEAKQSPAGSKGKRRRSKRSGSDSDSSESDSREESSSSDSDSDSSSGSDSDRRKKKSRKSKKSKRSRKNKDKKKDSSIPMTDAERKQALEDAMKKEAASGGKRGYRSNDNVKVPTDQDMENYMASKIHHDDPMAKFLGQD